jgi:hypothetical protein
VKFSVGMLTFKQKISPLVQICQNLCIMAQMSFFLYIIEYMASKNAWNERDRGK